MSESAVDLFRVRLRVLRNDPRFRGNPLRTAARLLRWKGHCLLGRAAVVDLPAWGMRMWLPPQWRGGAKLVYLLRDHADADALAVLPLLRPGQVVVDVGANLGLLTLAFARAVGPAGRVLAVEPAEETFGALERQVRINDLKHVTAIHAALADKPGAMRLYHHADPGRNSLVAGASDDGEEVPVTTLDALLAEHGIGRVDVLKIDVEGAEPLVLAGAAKTLGHRPVVVFEIHSQAANRTADPHAAWTALAALGYGFRVVTEGGLSPVTSPPTTVSNVVAIHPSPPNP